jgi:hypothetical protein
MKRCRSDLLEARPTDTRGSEGEPKERDHLCIAVGPRLAHIPALLLAHLVEVYDEVAAERRHQVSVAVESRRDRDVTGPGLDLFG